MTKRLAVAFVPPSGIGAGDFLIRLVDGGKHLELVLLQIFTTVNKIEHRKWLGASFEKSYPMLIGFEAALKGLTDLVDQGAHIRLPVQVLTCVCSGAGSRIRAWREDCSHCLQVYVHQSLST